MIAPSQAWEQMLRGALVLVGAWLLVACAGHDGIERVEEFPSGPQLGSTTGVPLKEVHTSHVSDRYRASYETVWTATKRIVKRVGETGLRPTASVDEEKGLILLTADHQAEGVTQAANQELPHLTGWKDEFRIEVTKLSGDRTKVTVSRRVLGLTPDRSCVVQDPTCQTRIEYEPELSNGRIEGWILTQIEDVVAGRR